MREEEGRVKVVREGEGNEVRGDWSEEMNG